jgi:hypothetical protein
MNFCRTLCEAKKTSSNCTFHSFHSSKFCSRRSHPCVLGSSTKRLLDHGGPFTMPPRSPQEYPVFQPVFISILSGTLHRESFRYIQRNNKKVNIALPQRNGRFIQSGKTRSASVKNTGHNFVNAYAHFTKKAF